MYALPVSIAPPKTYTNSSISMIGSASAIGIVSGLRVTWTRLRRSIAHESASAVYP
ncbi:hypothetical protein P9209_13590 [Prescottella defluvii]|nr:hypothetical protein P9209_13590 [Prescottella defluvii]